jgi:hypothetical protein
VACVNRVNVLDFIPFLGFSAALALGAMSTEVEDVLLPVEENASTEDIQAASAGDGLGLSNESDASASVVAWESVIRVVADAEPVPAAGAAGVIILIVLALFGRFGGLVIGVITGLLLHAGLEKRREMTLLHQAPSTTFSGKEIIPREVPYENSHSNFRNLFAMLFLQRATWHYAISWTF